MAEIKYRGYVIHSDFSWVHEDYDPTPYEPYDPPADNRAGRSRSLEQAKAAIDENIEENEDATD